MIERQRLIDAYTDLSRRLTVHYMKTGQPRESASLETRALYTNIMKHGGPR